MGDVQLGLFHLVDPPDGQTGAIADTLARIDYPFARIIPAIRQDPDQAVLVRWDPDMQQGATGLFYGHTYEIHLGTRYSGWEGKVPFVFAHEVGHMVDRATFDRDTRTAIMDLYHDSPETYRRDGQTLNDKVIEYAHSHEHRETWTAAQPHYYFKINESFADSFVAAFAPSVWAGKHPRFTHWTSDLDTVRRLTLQRRIRVFDDIDDDHPFREAIEWAAEKGLVKGWPDGTFRPNEPVTRQALAAILRRYDKQTA